MPSLDTADLRADAKGRQRWKNHNSKYVYGMTPRTGVFCRHDESRLFGSRTACDECAARPMKPDSKQMRKSIRRSTRGDQARVASASRQTFGRECDEAFGIGGAYSSYDSYDETDDTSEPDEFLYNYDRPTGPVHNSQVLSSAITQAVQRYENKETEKLVKEYDLVVDHADEPHFADAEDDFELVDTTDFN